jgi:hypothetical protein
VEKVMLGYEILMSMDKYILPCTKQQKGPNFTNAELLAD